MKIIENWKLYKDKKASQRKPGDLKKSQIIDTDEIKLNKLEVRYTYFYFLLFFFLLIFKNREIRT